jgi:hypothetical protein
VARDVMHSHIRNQVEGGGGGSRLELERLIRFLFLWRLTATIIYIFKRHIVILCARYETLEAH